VALPASDTFSGSAGQDLQAYAPSNWSNGLTGSTKVFECDGSGNARAVGELGSGDGNNSSKWIGDTFANDHYAEIVFDPAAGSYAGPAIRMGAAGSGNMYGLYADDTTIDPVELAAGSSTALGSSIGVSWSAGTHTLRLSATGTTLTITYDGSETTRSDATFTSGTGGLLGYSTVVGTTLVNSWTANDVVAPPTPVSYVNNALGGTATTTSFSITLPATAANDIIVLEYTHRGTGDATLGGTYSGPAFTEKHDQQYAASTFSAKTLWSRATGNHSRVLRLSPCTGTPSHPATRSLTPPSSVNRTRPVTPPTHRSPRARPERWCASSSRTRPTLPSPPRHVRRRGR
jgi:hypothetical protein